MCSTATKRLSSDGSLTAYDVIFRPSSRLTSSLTGSADFDGGPDGGGVFCAAATALVNASATAASAAGHEVRRTIVPFPLSLAGPAAAALTNEQCVFVFAW